jgi:hypothetical protein
MLFEIATALGPVDTLPDTSGILEQRFFYQQGNAATLTGFEPVLRQYPFGLTSYLA